MQVVIYHVRANTQFFENFLMILVVTVRWYGDGVDDAIEEDNSSICLLQINKRVPVKLCSKKSSSS